MSQLLPSSWTVPETIQKRLGNEYGKQRLMPAEGHLILVLHAMPEVGNPDRQGMLFWRNPEGDWQTNQPGPGLGNLKQLLENYRKRIDSLEDELEKTDALKALFSLQRTLVPLCRAMKHTHQVLQDAREAAPEAPELINLRDQAYTLERAATLLQSDVQTAIDFERAEQGEIQAELSLKLTQEGHKLNLLATVFLPLTAITSLFGMNLASGLNNDNPLYFWIVLTVGALIGFLVKATLPKK